MERSKHETWNRRIAVQLNEKMTKTEYDDLIAWSLENESKCDNSDESFENIFE